MNKLLGKKIVTINNISREVSIKIENNIMFGVLNKTKFVWRFADHDVPSVQVSKGVEFSKASSYGRLFILERLKMEGIELPIKQKESKVPFMHISTKNGVWLNVFVNGYIRGAVNGQDFTWLPSIYPDAAFVTEKGEKGKICAIAGTREILRRIREEGYKSCSELINSVKTSKGIGATKENKPAAKENKPTIPFTASLDKFIYIEKYDNIIIRLHKDRLTGVVNGALFTWKPSDGNSKLDPNVKDVIKDLGFKSFNDLKHFYSRLLSSKNLWKFNTIFNLFNGHECLRGLMRDMQAGSLYNPAAIKTLEKALKELSMMDGVSDETITAVKSALDLFTPIIKGQTLMAI